MCCMKSVTEYRNSLSDPTHTDGDLGDKTIFIIFYIQSVRKRVEVI